MQLAGQPVSVLELLAFVSGLASVWLALRLHIANWPLGIASVLCFAWVFFQAKLYADSVLQLVFVAVCLYGWREWRLRGAGGTIAVRRMRGREALGATAAGSLATAACAWLLRTHTDSPVPWIDSAVLAFSLVATWAQARGSLESWFFWIAVDVVSIPLYWSRSLPLTAGLYTVFLALCVAGWLNWRSRLRAQPA